MYVYLRGGVAVERGLDGDAVGVDDDGADDALVRHQALQGLLNLRGHGVRGVEWNGASKVTATGGGFACEVPLSREGRGEGARLSLSSLSRKEVACPLSSSAPLREAGMRKIGGHSLTFPPVGGDVVGKYNKREGGKGKEKTPSCAVKAPSPPPPPRRKKSYLIRPLPALFCCRNRVQDLLPSSPLSLSLSRFTESVKWSEIWILLGKHK